MAILSHIQHVCIDRQTDCPDSWTPRLALIHPQSKVGNSEKNCQNHTSDFLFFINSLNTRYMFLGQKALKLLNEVSIWNVPLLKWHGHFFIWRWPWNKRVRHTVPCRLISQNDTAGECSSKGVIWSGGPVCYLKCDCCLLMALTVQRAHGCFWGLFSRLCSLIEMCALDYKGCHTKIK